MLLRCPVDRGRSDGSAADTCAGSDLAGIDRPGDVQEGLVEEVAARLPPIVAADAFLVDGRQRSVHSRTSRRRTASAERSVSWSQACSQGNSRSWWRRTIIGASPPKMIVTSPGSMRPRFVEPDAEAGVDDRVRTSAAAARRGGSGRIRAARVNGMSESEDHRVVGK